MANMTARMEVLEALVAAQGDLLQDTRDTLDDTWIISRTFAVLAMQAGFAMLEAGLVSSRNTSSILMKNIADMAVSAIGFFFIGWAVAFGPEAVGAGGLSSFMGTSQFALVGVSGIHALVFFQWSFAATSSTIVSGAAAGRMKFIAYVLLSFLQSTFVYPFVAHWVWSTDGWLYKLGVIDLAGQGAVHLLGGSVGLMATLYLGPRSGVFTSTGVYMPVRASPLNAAFGTLILWYCWFEFNAGSTLGVTGGRQEIAALVSWNSGLASGAGTAFALLYSFIKSKGQFVDVFMVVTGLLSGLVGITGGAGVVPSYSAMIIGAASAAVGIWTTDMVAHFRIDDPVGAIPVHVCVSAFGMLTTAFFALPPSAGRGNTLAGILYGGDGTLLGVQLAAILVIFAWGCLFGIGLMYLVDWLVGLRITSGTEKSGMDEAEHNLVAIQLDDLDIESSQSGSTTARSTMSSMEGDGDSVASGDSDQRGADRAPPSSTKSAATVTDQWVEAFGALTRQDSGASRTGGRGGAKAPHLPAGPGPGDDDEAKRTTSGGIALPPIGTGVGGPLPPISPQAQAQAPAPAPGPTPAQVAKAKRRRERQQRKLAKRLMRLTANMMRSANSSERVFVPRDQADAVRSHYAAVARAQEAAEDEAERRAEEAEFVGVTAMRTGSSTTAAGSPTHGGVVVHSTSGGASAAGGQGGSPVRVTMDSSLGIVDDT